MRSTCDDNVQKLYVDGELQAAQETDSIWTEETTTTIPESSRLLGVECEDTGSIYGILLSVHDASGEVILETGDLSWNCSKADYSGSTWASVDAELGGSWSPAIQVNGPTSGKIGDISTSAKWIWAEKGGELDTVYCRGRIYVGG